MKPTKIMFAVLPIAAVLFCVAGALSAAEDTSWFDMGDCAMCAPMMAEKGLMEHMMWENHKVATGTISVTMVEPEFVEAYERAEQKMTELSIKLASGEKMPLCGHCQSINDLMAAGAKMDNFRTGAGYVMAITATNPELIAKIHTHCDRTTEEMSKFEKTEEQAH